MRDYPSGTAGDRIALILSEVGWPQSPTPRCWFDGCEARAAHCLTVTNVAKTGGASAPLCPEHLEVLQLEAAVDMDFSRLTIEWERERITLAPR